MKPEDVEKLRMYLKGILDWAQPNPDLPRDMLIHEMRRIAAQAQSCLKIVERGTCESP